MHEGAPIIIKKKKVSGHGHHGGAWKVAYADFVTAMMAFFLVMWIMGMDAEDRAQIQGAFNDPNVIFPSQMKGAPIVAPSGRRSENPIPIGAKTGQEQEEMAEDQQAVETLKNQVDKALEATSTAGELSLILNQIMVKVTSEGLEIEFVEGKGMVFFEVGSAVVRPQARKLIASIAPAIAKSGRFMMIDGHTDARPYVGNNYDNWDLSGERALAVRRILTGAGVNPKQIMAIRAFAATKPKLTDALDPRNRRVTVTLPFKNGVEKWVNEVDPAALVGKEAAAIPSAKPEPVNIREHVTGH